MRSTLLIQADRDHADSCRWLILDAEGKSAGTVRSGTPAAAAAEAAGLRVVALAHGIDCVLTQVSIPGSNRQKLLRAVPFALEEQFSEDVEDLHFAVGPALAGGEYPVAVVAIQRMNALLEVFTSAGLEVHQLLPDLLTIPCSADAICVVIDGDVSLVRSGPYSGFAVDTGNLELLLASQLDQGDDDTQSVHITVPAGSTLPDLGALGARVEIEHTDASALVVLARGLASPSIDLLQGAYSRSREWSKLWRPWRASAALLLVGIVLAHAVQGVDYVRLKQQQAELNSRIETVFKETFPGTRKVVNARVQMQQQLEQLQRQGGGGTQFMTLLARAGDVLRSASDVDITGASFRAGRLDLDLTVASLQILDQLKQTLSARGLTVEIQSATTEGDQRVKSRLRIQGGSA
ncbi:MAG: type II secretion system protein GspL [Gammaproteobacteria bacterium]|nr:type II secretion system protein GspL [Gammaproteobacteria bacterium]